MRLATIILGVLVSCAAFAGVGNPNPNLTISIFGSESFNIGGPGQ